MPKIDREGIIIEFGADTAEFDVSINNINRAFDILKKNIRAIDKELKIDPTNLEQLDDKMKSLQQQIELTKLGLEQYRKELEKLDKIDPAKRTESENAAYARYNKAIIEAESSLVLLDEQEQKLAKHIEDVRSGLYQKNQQLKNNSEKWKEYGEIIKEVGDSLTNVGQALAPVSAVAGSALKGAIQNAMDFESALTGVYKTVDETPTTSYERIEQTIRRMATELPTSAAEIANIMEMAGQLGIKADDLEKFSKVMIDLGNATNITGSEGAAAIAQFYNVMGGNLDTVDRFGSAITHLGNNSATTENDIMYMAKTLSAMGRQLELSEADVLGLATSLASVGLSAERGGSAISTIFRKVDTDVADVGKNASKHVKVWADLLGVTNDRFKEMWNTERISTMRQMIGALATTKDEGGNLYAVLNDLNISNIRQVDSITRLTGAYAKFDEYMDMANTAWEENTALTLEANRRYGTTESQIQVLKNNITELGIVLGQELLPIINDLIKENTPIFKTIANLIKGNGELIASILGITAATSPLLLFFGRTIKGAGNAAMAISRYSKLASESTGVTRALAIAMGGATKFGLVAGFAAAAIGLTALAAAFVYNNNEMVKFRREVNNLSKSLQESNEAAKQEYQSRQLQIDGASYYAQKLEEVYTAQQNSSAGTEEYIENTAEMQKYVDLLNEALGNNAYYIDEETGKLMYNGEIVDNVKKSYEELAAEMAKTAWLEAHKSAFIDASETERKGYELNKQAADAYAETISQLPSKYQTVPQEVVQSVIDYANGYKELQDVYKTMQENGMNVNNQQDMETVSRIMANATTAVDNFNKKNQEADALISQSRQTIDQYNQVLSATPEEFNGIIGSFATADIAVENNTGKLEAQKQKLIEMNDAYKNLHNGEDNEYYMQQINAIDEQILKIQAAQQEEANRQRENEKNAKSSQDSITSYGIGKNNEMTANELTNATRASGESKTLWEKAWNIAAAYINSSKLDDKILTIYTNIIGGEQVGLRGSYYGFNTAGSGGFQSGGYQVNLTTNVNVNGNPTVAQARSFAMQMVDIVNDELGKRVKYG